MRHLLFVIVAAIALGSPLVGISAEREVRSFCLAAPRGIADNSPCLSPDGQALLWLHREASVVRLCLLKAPWTGPESFVEIPYRYEGKVCKVELSQDGRHIFVAVGCPNGIYHVSLQDSHLGVPELLPNIKDIEAFHLSSNADGSRLAVLVDGVSTPRRSPGWRAVAILERTNQGWERGAFLTPAEEGRMAWDCRITSDGSRLTYILDDKPFLAEWRQSKWASEKISFTGLERVTIMGVSADGKSLAFSAWPAGVPLPTLHPHLANLYYTQWLDGHWQTPVMLMADQQSNIYNVCISPDGKTVIWIHYTRGEDQNTIVRTEFRSMRQGKEGWSKPITVFRGDEFVQCRDVSITDNGAIAFSRYHLNAPPDGLCEETFLIPKLKENAKPISISQLVQKKQERQEAGKPTKITEQPGPGGWDAAAKPWRSVPIMQMKASEARKMMAQTFHRRATSLTHS